MDQCRALDFDSVNMDLIYGLPFQNDLLCQYRGEDGGAPAQSHALYSFAHIPWIKKHQKRIDPETLPEGEEKVQIFTKSTEALTNGPYQAIAMDHFALEDDEMAVAYREGRLNRNFMGYTVFAGVGLFWDLEGGIFHILHTRSLFSKS